MEDARKHSSEPKYIQCEALLDAPKEIVLWDYYKGQAHPGTEFNGRALLGRCIRVNGGLREGTVTQYRQETAMYFVEYGNKQAGQFLKEQELLDYLVV